MLGPFVQAPGCSMIRFKPETTRHGPEARVEWRDNAGQWHQLDHVWKGRYFPPFAEMFKLIHEASSK